MPVDIEQTLARELREVAEGLDVPPMPPLRTPHRPDRRIPPLLLVAAVVAIVAGAFGAVTTFSNETASDPAQPSPTPSLAPTPSPTASPAPIPGSAPRVPHVLGDRLYVDGGQVPGSWWSVDTGGDAWIAAGGGMPVTWWWGRGPEPRELPNGENVTPKISPSGRYVAVVRAENGKGILTVIDTRTGQDLEGTPTNIGPVKWDVGAYVVAVTDEPTVVVRRGDGYVTWSEDAVTDTLSGQMVFDATPAGVVAGDVDGGRPYLARMSSTGELTRIGDLPEHDALAVSPDGAWVAWVAWTPIGITEGEVSAVPSLQVGTLDGDQVATLSLPDGWRFQVRTWVWEEGGYLVSVVSDDRGRQRLARCRPMPAECLLVRTG